MFNCHWQGAACVDPRVEALEVENAQCICRVNRRAVWLGRVLEHAARLLEQAFRPGASFNAKLR
jgi:hypothetical protein